MTEPTFDELLSDQGRFMRRLAYEVLGDAHLAEDLNQEAWLRVRSSPNAASPATSAWWRTVVRNLGRSWRLADGARLHRERAAARSERIPSTADEIERVELLTRVARAVQSLPEPYRAVILQRYWEGPAPREIARLRGLPVTTVKSQLQRGLRRLRVALEDSGGRPLPGLMAMAFAHRTPNLLPTLVMQTKIKLVGAVLVLSCLGAWGLTRQASGPSAPRADPTPSPNGATTSTDLVHGGQDSLATIKVTGAERAVAAGAPITSSEVRLSGRILDANGRAIEGARFQIDADHGAITDAEGRYALAAMARKTYEFAVDADGYVPLRARLTVPLAKTHALRDLVLKPGRELLTYVIDEQGNAVAGASVFLLEQPDPLAPVRLRPLGSTGPDGALSHASLPLRTCRLGVLARGFAPHMIEFPSGHSSGHLTAVLSTGWNVMVLVQDTELARGNLRLSARPATGSPLADDEFSWVLHAERHWPLGSQAEALIEGLAQGEPYYLQLEELETDGKWRSCAESLRIDAPSSEAKIAYQPTAQFTIAPRDAVSGATVTAFRLLSAPPSVPLDPLPDGVTYELAPGVHAGFRIEAAGYASEPVPTFTLAPGEKRSMNPLLLQPTRMVDVAVHDARTGAPLNGVTLRALETEDPPRWRQSAHTDAHGRARVLATSALVVKHPGYCGERMSLIDSADTLRIDLHPGATVEIHVLDEHGTPVPNLRVECRAPSPGAEPDESQTSDFEGRVLFHGLQPGEYEFAVVEAERFSQRIMKGGSIAQVTITEDKEESNGLRLMINEGQEHQADLLVPARIELSGIVTEAGVPVSGVGVHVLERDVGLHSIIGLITLGDPQLSTDSHGRFRIPVVASGPITLVATHAGRHFPHALQLELRESTHNIELKLPTGTLRGTVREANGDPISGAVLSLVVAGPRGSYMQSPRIITQDSAGVMSMHRGGSPAQKFTTDANGRYEIEHAPPGYTLRVEASASESVTVLKTVKLLDGQDKTLDFALKPAGSLHVDVVMADGSAPVNCLISLEWKGPGSEPGQEKFLGHGSSHTFGGLRPGTWEASVSQLSPEGASRPLAREVREGESSTATLTVTR